nr:RNA-directed DNA polymerase, eukaryota [Tanacetum cinerariifolium]
MPFSHRSNINYNRRPGDNDWIEVRNKKRIPMNNHEYESKPAKSMGNFCSKEDDVARISTSVFISNIPDSVLAKDLFHACNQYGHVVDSYILFKKDKNGNRFGFVRFINVFNTERLGEKSYAGVVKNEGRAVDEFSASKAALVIDDECLNSKDLSLALLRRVKEFASLVNLKMAIGNEGFAEININSIASWFTQIINASNDFETEGRIAWVEVEGVLLKLWSDNTFRRIAAKWGNLLDVDDHDDKCYHSKRICIHMKDGRFIKDEFKITQMGKAYWIRANETVGWVPDFYEESDDDISDDNSTDEGAENQVSGDGDNRYPRNDAANNNEVEMVQDTIFESVFSEEVLVNIQNEGVEQVPITDKSEDPFGIYSFLNKAKNNDGSECMSGNSPEFPPGFTPPADKDEAIGNADAGNTSKCNAFETKEHKENLNDAVSGNYENLNNKEDEEDSSSGGHFKKSGCPRSGGSILGVLEEVVKDFLQLEISKWKGETIIMRDFNEVRYKSNRFGSNFNAHGANLFNSFISNSSLAEVNLGVSRFTWCHKSAKKMSKLDRFLVSKNLLVTCPNLNAITLERFLSDHRPILLRENQFDYGPTSFRFIHYWIEMEGFRKLVEDSWKISPKVGSNAIKILMGKLKYLKNIIREWNRTNMGCRRNVKLQHKKDLENVNQILDSRQGDENDVRTRSEIMLKLQKCDEIDSLEMAQKAKIKWAVEGDENSKFFHGMLNKKRSTLSIRGVLVEGIWVDDPKDVKNEFFVHFSKRFCKPNDRRASLCMEFPNRLNPDQVCDLETEVTKDEIKKLFGIVVRTKRRDLTVLLLASSVNSGCNSSFIALIPKIPYANVVKDFRPICLIGCIYKIIAKILTNRLINVLGDLVNEVQSAFVANRQILDGLFILNELFQWCKTKKKQTLIFKVDFEKAYDSVRWDFLDEVLCKFGFGEKWRKWIQRCLLSSRGSILINGSPTEEFLFGKGLKQGDPLSPFLFILIMESLHLSFQRVMDVGLFRGIKVHDMVNISHLFYADDVVFVRQWSERNISTLTHVLECFYLASGLKINMSKSEIMGIHVNNDIVNDAAVKLGCLVLKAPFTYLGSMVGVEEVSILAGQTLLVRSICKGIDLMQFIKIKLGNGDSIRLWDDPWYVDGILKEKFPRVYALESCKSISIRSKLAQSSLSHSFHRTPRGGIEMSQFDEFSEMMQHVNLVPTADRWVWLRNNSGEFSVASVRHLIDEKVCTGGDQKTTWIRYIPNKVNIYAWKVMSNSLATKFNISRRGIEIDSITCVNCGIGVETTSHLFFTCDMAQQVRHLINLWWDVPDMEIDSYASWKMWMGNICLHGKIKMMFEGVYNVMWWLLWWYRNQKTFEAKAPNKAVFFDDVVAKSFYWCRSRSKASFSWNDWLKNPNLITL